ncbi:MAG: hypothetical protein N839_0001845 [Desulfofustis sp. PB-SRB1]|jgi:hypothetical protein|nr:hypothetical protein [Desulfofustis sp. PB-SRB1]MBM1001133.1 hypothetical protein [Desulfofustis sp. PB-SRB1]HBH27447.1 hypothetical protein [Desulfofustis sp.]HBH32364.1 hypothetical protein [Desulfofustis sp.]
MRVFDGIYNWDGKKHDGRDPITWFPGAYHLIIHHLAGEDPGPLYLKPYLVIFSETGSGQSIGAQPEKFAKHICVDFQLDIERVLWVEQFRGEVERFEVVVFTRTGDMGTTAFYKTQRRPPNPAEERLIKRTLGVNN